MIQSEIIEAISILSKLLFIESLDSTLKKEVQDKISALMKKMD